MTADFVHVCMTSRVFLSKLQKLNQFNGLWSLVHPKPAIITIIIIMIITVEQVSSEII